MTESDVSPTVLRRRQAERDKSDLITLNPDSVRLLTAGGITRLTLESDRHPPDGSPESQAMREPARSYLRVNVGRAFPVSDPSHYIGFQDGAGKDIGILVDPSTLDAESQRILQAELERRYFVPVIEEILNVKEEFGAVYWQARTDRGEKEIVVRNLKDSIHELPAGRAIITDVDGNRYLIPDTQRLDPKTTNILLRSL